MSNEILAALIGSGGTTLVAIAALILSYRGFATMDSRFASADSRMASMEARLLSIESSNTTRFDLIMGKLADLDTRLSVMEDRRK
jgi:hypothetical protein